MLPAETVLANRYKLLDELGQGGAAVVYRAEDLRLGRTVAVKVLRPAYVADPEQAARFAQEARSAAALTAPNIVDVYDYGQDGGMTFIVMQYVDGTDLKHVIQGQGRLPPDEAARIAIAVAHGLEAAHERGLIHRDVKPQNILVDSHGQVRLTDFGVAKALGGPGLTQAGTTYGTAAYLSPEQATGGIIGPPADIYALGIVLYEMLCGQPPFEADNAAAMAYKQVYEQPPPLRDCAPSVPPALAAIVGRALEKDPAARYPSAATLGADLEAFRQSGDPPLPGYQPTAAYAVPAPSPNGARGWPGTVAAPAARTRAGRLWLLPLLLLLLAGGFVGSRYVHINTGPPSVTPVSGGGLPPFPRPAVTAAPSASAAAAGASSPTPAGAVLPPSLAPVPPTASAAPSAPTNLPGPPPAATVPPAATEAPAPPAPTDSPGPPPAATAPPAPPAPAASPTASGGPGRPVFDTPTPPTGSNRRVVLEDVAFSGGYRYAPPSVYEGRTAVWVYGQGTSFASMTAPFILTKQPVGTAKLALAGMDSEDKAKTPLRALINGQVIYNGPDPLPNDYSPNAGSWGATGWSFPAVLLHPGENTLTIENLSPSGAIGVPFIMIDGAVVEWDAEQ